MNAQSQQETVFLDRLAKALGRNKRQTTPPKREAVGPPAFWREMKQSDDEVLERFKRNLEALSGRVFIADSAEAVQKQLKEWLQELKAQKVLCSDNPKLKEVAAPESMGVQVEYWNKNKNMKELLDFAKNAEVGLTWSDYAIGYTGTQALFSSAAQGRTVSLLTPNHISIFERSQLVPTMSHVINDITERNGAADLPGAINFITGPSRTSDIEMDLSIGVHGPYKTWVIILK